MPHLFYKLTVYTYVFMYSPTFKASVPVAPKPTHNQVVILLKRVVDVLDVGGTVFSVFSPRDHCSAGSCEVLQDRTRRAQKSGSTCCGRCYSTTAVSPPNTNPTKSKCDDVFTAGDLVHTFIDRDETYFFCSASFPVARSALRIYSLSSSSPWSWLSACLCTC